MDKADDGIAMRLSATDRSSFFSAPNLLSLFTAIALLIAAVRAVVPGWWTPLWLDETYTATIATQPSFAGLIDWCLHELSGPVYYTLTWIWVHVFGASSASLRMPSLICAIATPLLILWKGHPSRDVRMLWALLLATWLPGVTFPSEARPYAMLMLLATGQVILYYRLVEDGGRHRALAWSSLSAFAVLTHYYMLPVTALQGLLYLVLRRHEIPKTWPAALIFIPVGMWMAIHLPFVLSFTNPGVAWYPKLTPEHAWLVPFVLMGGNFAAGLLFVAMVPMLAFHAVRSFQGQEGPYSKAELAAAGSAILAATCVVVIGFFKATFLIRYFVPFMPGMMFGLALWTAAVARKYMLLPHALALTAIIFGGAQVNELVRHPELDIRNQFSFEGASDWLRARGARRLIFFWDNSTASISTPERLGEVGSYFMRSKGWRGEVIVPPIAGNKGINPNTVLAERASQPRDGIMWAYDENFGGSLGRKMPSTLGQAGSPFDCRDFGRKRIRIITCIRR